MALETVALEAVEILSVGGPIHGVGSPPEGDHWTADQLRGMAEAAAELGDELKPPAKIGHKGGDPAVGWLENVRVNEAGDKLLADIKNVPKGLSGLIDVGAYRTRSVELGRVTSQKTGRKFDWAVTGLAWLGGKMPAVRTLADVVKLYDGDDADRLFVEVTENEPVLSERLLETVIDLAVSASKEQTGLPTPAPDSRPVDPKYTDEQRRTFAEATGLEADKVTDELLEKAGVPVAEAAPGDEDPARENEAKDELRRELDEIRADVDAAKTELHVERRTAFVEDALKSGRVAPGAKAKLEKLYDLDSAAAREFVAELPIDESLAREYGADGNGDDDEQDEETTKAYEADMARRLGVTAEELI